MHNELHGLPIKTVEQIYQEYGNVAYVMANPEIPVEDGVILCSRG